MGLAWCATAHGWVGGWVGGWVAAESKTHKNRLAKTNGETGVGARTWSGMYDTLPIEALKVGESTSLGTGMMISTLFAIDRDLN